MSHKLHEHIGVNVWTPMPPHVASQLRASPKPPHAILDISCAPMSSRAISCHTMCMPCHLMLRMACPCHATSCHLMPSQVHAMPPHGVLCHLSCIRLIWSVSVYVYMELYPIWSVYMYMERERVYVIQHMERVYVHAA